MSTFTRAIVRPPGRGFAAGLTTSDLGAPDVDLAIAQHDAYCRALESIGLELVRLAVDDRHPDSTFVEDTAILTSHGAVLTRPGAPSREGEVEAIREAVERYFPALVRIEAPGTVDGGDICEAGDHVFIGLSHRTNEEGARQLAAILTRWGYTSSTVDIREVSGILHLKSGMGALADGSLVVIEALADRPEFRGRRLLRMEAGDEYAANCVAVNGRVLVAEGFPRFEAMLRQAGHEPLPLGMSEYRKMDGGLSCLSLRF